MSHPESSFAPALSFKRSLVVCSMGSLAIATLLVFLPWGALGAPLAAATDFLIRIISYSFFVLASLATWSLRVSLLVLIAMVLFFICAARKGVFKYEDEGAIVWPPIASRFVATIAGLAMLWALVFLVTWIGLLARTSEAGQVDAPNSVYTRLMLNGTTGSSEQRWTNRLEDQLRSQGVASDVFSRAVCRLFANHSSSPWLRITINGQQPDASLCRFGPNTVTWTVIKPVERSTK